ncbi:helix-turn-helix domain-containing protein [Clostridium sp. E02]|uniref:AraC family transcriptional regulator n=1 Tax=Clostridium sp. E02 TaxID=2487134 RepID=UPI000F5349B8|nr:helix-turn-helix domain-containing protein [Clostridium sp. E02]
MEEYRHEFIVSDQDMNIKLSFSIDTGSNVNKHYHNWIEIVYLIRGTLEFQDNNQTRFMKENDFVIVNPMSIHSTRCIDGNTAILLQVPMSFLEKIMPDLYHYRFSLDMDSKDPKVVTKLNKIRDIMKDLWIAYEFHVEGYPFRCYSLVFELIYILVHSFSYQVDEVNKIKTEKNMQRMQTIMEYVQGHYREDLSLGRISEVIGLNPVYFSRFFKAQTGITFLEYLNTVRMEHVYKDLLNTDLPVKDIQVRHGLYNTKLFRRIFKKMYGCTPKEARKSK